MNRVAYFSLLLAAALWGVSFYFPPPFDPDLGWQLFGGSWILQHGEVPRADPINAFNLVWHDYHWLAQIFIFKVYQLWSWTGLKLLLAVTSAVMLILSVINSTATESAKKLLPVIGLATLGWLVSEVLSLRPQLFALIFLLLAQFVLQRRIKGSLIFIFVLTAITANMHVYWVFFPMLWLCYRTLPQWYSGEFHRIDLYSPLILLLAPVLSPYGVFGLNSGGSVFENYFLLISYLHTPAVVTDTVAEFRSTLALSLKRSIPFLVLLMTLAWCWNRKVAKENLPDILISVITALFAVVAAKYLGLFCTIGAAGVIKLLEQSSSAAQNRSVWALAVALTATIRLLILPQVDALEGINQVEPYSQCRHLGVEYNESHSARILTHFDHGGWCRFALHEVRPEIDFRVTTDNRTQSVPSRHYDLMYDLFRLRGGWNETLSSWKPDFAVMHKDFPLTTMLLLAKQDWAVVQYSGPFVLMKRKSG